MRAFLVAYALLMPLALGVLALWHPLWERVSGPGSEKLAAWVQAVGTIIAIFATYLIAQAQAARERTRDERQQSARQAAAARQQYETMISQARTVRALAQLAVFRLDVYRSACSQPDIEPDFLRHAVRALRLDAEQIAAFPLHTLQVTDGIAPFAALPGLLELAAVQMTDRADQLKASPGSVSAIYAEAAKELAALLEIAKNRAEDLKVATDRYLGAPLDLVPPSASSLFSPHAHADADKSPMNAGD